MSQTQGTATEGWGVPNPLCWGQDAEAALTTGTAIQSKKGQKGWHSHCTGIGAFTSHLLESCWCVHFKKATTVRKQLY